MSILKTNAIVDVTGGNAVTINGVLLNAGTVSSDDRIINGDFGIWQRGANFTTGAYGADRWLTSGTGANISQSRQAFAVGDTLGVNSPTYFLRQATSLQSLSTQYALTTQRIEGVRSYAGQTITVLGWARRSSGDGNMSIDADQVFGTGNVLGIGQNTVVLTTSWAPFAAVMLIPSISGKTISAINNYLAINFWISAGSSYNARTNSLGLQTIGVDLWGIHIKHGIHTPNVVDLYRPRDPGTELALCQRYYQRWDLSGTMAASGGPGLVATKYSTTDPVMANLPLNAVMRVPPTLNVTPTTARFVTNNGGTPTVSVGSYSTDGIRPITMLYYNGAVGPGYGWIDTIGIVSADAET